LLIQFIIETKMNKITEFYYFIETANEAIRKYSHRFLQQDNKEFKQNYPDLHRQLEKQYFAVFGVKVNSAGCGSCFIDRLFELKQLKLYQVMNRLNLNSQLKEGYVANIEGEFYTAQSPHLTNEICDKIYQKYGLKYFEKYEPTGDEPIKIPSIPEKFTAKDLADYFDVQPPATDTAKQTVKEPKKTKAPKTKKVKK
jgi:hypothetical protein